MKPLQPEPADRLSELLDGDDAAVQEPTFSEPSSAEVAEQLFAAGALKHFLAADEGHLDRQVGRALAAVTMSGHRSPLRSLWVWAATAAAVLLIVFVVVSQRPEELMATVGRVIDVAQLNVDREFVLRSLPDEDSALADQPEGRVIVHGSSKFAVMIPGPMSDVWLGSDGKEFWFDMPPMGLMRFGDPDRMQEHAKRLGFAIEAFRLPNLLQRLRRDYNVALTKDSTEPEDRIDFTAQRRDDIEILAPEYIRGVADRRTGRLHKLVITFGPDRPPLVPWVMFLKLVSEEPKPDGFYSADHRRR